MLCSSISQFSSTSNTWSNPQSTPTIVDAENTNHAEERRKALQEHYLKSKAAQLRKIKRPTTLQIHHRWDNAAALIQLLSGQWIEVWGLTTSHPGCLGRSPNNTCAHEKNTGKVLSPAKCMRRKSERHCKHNERLTDPLASVSVCNCHKVLLFNGSLQLHVEG